MQSYNDNTEHDHITEGWLQNVHKFASIGGLAASMALGNDTQAHAEPVGNKTNSTQTISTSGVSDVSMFDYIKQWEGLRTTVYKDHVGNPTIGVGHYLNDSDTDRHQMKALFGDKLSYDALLDGSQSLTAQQAEKLFAVDVKVKEKLATQLMPDYKTFNQGTKNAIVNALYRGDLGRKTIKLINDNNWKAAAAQYLNHTNAKTGPEQVKRRMKTNAALLLQNDKTKAKP